MRTRAALTLALLIFLGGATAEAQDRNNQNNRWGGLRARNSATQRGGSIRQASSFNKQVNQFVKSNRLKSFTKRGKPVIGLKGLNDMGQYLKMGNKNVVEFFVRSGFHHLYTRVPGKNPNGAGDKQWVFSRITGLSRTEWRQSSGEQVSVLVELTDKEMGRLNQYLDKARENPSQVLGKFVYAGGRPPNASNCTSYITCAAVGDRGESLARVLGVYESGMPQSFLRSLMNNGNDRVKAVVVHNPTGTEFNERYDLNHSLR